MAVFHARKQPFCRRSIRWCGIVARALDLFGFDYKIEVYTPAPKRKYGYFTLPILYNNALIGRLDPKAHRKEGIFEVKAIHFEPGVVVDDLMIAAIKSALQACAAWHKTPQLLIRDNLC